MPTSGPGRAIRVLWLEGGAIQGQRLVAAGEVAVLRDVGDLRGRDGDDAVALRWASDGGTLWVPPRAGGRLSGHRGTTWLEPSDGHGRRAAFSLELGHHGRVDLGARSLLFRVVSTDRPAALGVATDLRPALCEDDGVLALSLGSSGGLGAALLLAVWSAAPVAEVAIREVPSAIRTMVYQSVAPVAATEPAPVPSAAVAPRTPQLVASAAGSGADPSASEPEPGIALFGTRGPTSFHRWVGSDDPAGAALDGVVVGPGLDDRPFGTRVGPDARRDAVVALRGPRGGGTDLGGPAVMIPLTGTVDPGTPEPEDVVGCADPEALRAAIEARAGQLVYCYERELLGAPELEGRVEVEWRIDGGRAHDVVPFTNTTGSATLGACIVEKVERWRFDADESCEVVYPFVFRPKS
jgi:hypothetical protein